ncbi:MAG: glycosyltransferase family 4 protein, partial [Clostridia bacterium]|nr:glycosyltransferase family 4 protein [Clostridia bacterium]
MTRQIFINGRFLMNKPTGIERVAYELCRGLQRKGVDFSIVCSGSGKIYEEYDLSSLNVVRFGFGFSHFWEQIILPFFFLFKRNYLLMCFSGLGPILVKNKVLTIHDLSFLVNPAWFSKSYYWFYKLLTPLSALSSIHIITVSNFSKEEILHHYTFLNKDKISVVYNAAKIPIDKINIEKSKEEKAFFLVVASFDPRKNIEIAIEAMKDNKDYSLTVVGNPHRAFREVELSQNENINYIGRLTFNEVVKLYAKAKALIFPSLYEGFGLPAIEAMQMGCIVIASDIPVFHEVCG